MTKFVQKVKNFFESESIKFLPLQKLQLIAIGVWPLEVESTNFYIFYGIFNSIFNFVTTIPEFVFCYLHLGDLEEMLASLGPAITRMGISFKMLVMVWKRKEFSQVLQTLRNHYENYLTLSEICFSRRLAKRSFRICFILSLFSNSTGIFFTILPTFRYLNQFFEGNSPEIELLFKSEWPWQWKKRGFYEITLLLQTYGNILTGFGIAGIDCLMMGLFFHTASEFQSISFKIGELRDEIENKTPDLEALSKAENEKIEQKIIKIVEKYCACIDLCAQLRHFAIEIVMEHLLTSSIVVCMASVNLLIADWSQKPVYMTYILTVLAQAFVYCYGGELMSASSGQLATDFYMISWHKLDGARRDVLRLSIQRAQISMDVNVPFFKASLSTFGNILRTAGSYITLIKTFLKQ